MYWGKIEFKRCQPKATEVKNNLVEEFGNANATSGDVYFVYVPPAKEPVYGRGCRGRQRKNEEADLKKKEADLKKKETLAKKATIDLKKKQKQEAAELKNKEEAELQKNKEKAELKKQAELKKE